LSHEKRNSSKTGERNNNSVVLKRAFRSVLMSVHATNKIFPSFHCRKSDEIIDYNNDTVQAEHISDV